MTMRKRAIIIFLALACAFQAHAQMRWNQAYQTYIDQYKDIAIEEMLKHGIPASITLAQGVFESGAGRSELATRGNNHFGIKCHNWTGPTMKQDDDARGECFRVYRNARESYADHSRFLANNSRYRRLFSLKRTDYKGWARGLKECGYATNPQYAQKLIGLIELYGLYEYDYAMTYDKFMAKRTEDKPVSRSLGLHPIYLYNSNYYIYARSGDTFRSIGKEIGISGRQIAKFNERDYNDKLTEGDIIYLKKKQSKALKEFKNHPHTVQAGESMYIIAQKYGIRLKSLYKLNKLPKDYQIQVGDQLRVR